MQLMAVKSCKANPRTLIMSGYQSFGIEMSELEWFWNLALWGVNVYWMQVRVFHGIELNWSLRWNSIPIPYRASLNFRLGWTYWKYIYNIVLSCNQQYMWGGWTSGIGNCFGIRNYGMKWNGMELCRIEMKWQNLLELLRVESQL